MRPPTPIVALLLPVLAALAGAKMRAHAAPTPTPTPLLECASVAPGGIVVDGLLDEWASVVGLAHAGPSAKDARVELRCLHDDTTLYLAVVAMDDMLLRRARGDRGAEDVVSLTLGTDLLALAPGDARKQLAARATWNSKPARWLNVADSRQPNGWSIEVPLPLARLTRPGSPVGQSLAFSFQDADQPSKPDADETVTHPGARIAFAEAGALFRDLLAAVKLAPKAITLDLAVDMDGEPGVERVVAGGRIVGVVSDRFEYLVLPVQRAEELRSVQVVDLAGDGRHVVLAHWVETWAGGARELVGAFGLRPDGSFPRIWSHEVAITARGWRLANRWSLVPRKPQRGRPAAGKDLLIEADPATPFTHENWGQEPATDANPILLPWSERRSALWHFSDDGAHGGEAP